MRQPWMDEAFAALRPEPGESRPPALRPAATIGLAGVLLASAAWFIVPPTPHKIGAGPAATPERVPTASSERLAQAPRGPAPSPEVKVVGGASETGKPCDEQTWPYIEQRCLSAAQEPAPAARPQPLSPAARDDQAVGSITAIAPTPPVSLMKPPGAAPDPVSSPPPSAPESKAPARAADPAPARTAERTPAPKPAAPTPPEPARTEAAPERTVGFAAKEPGDAEKPANLSQQRRAPPGAARPDILPESASEGARPPTRSEQRRATAKPARQPEPPQARSTVSDPNRIVRRWTEYTYQEPTGGSRRVIVVRRGSRDDPFFRSIR